MIKRPTDISSNFCIMPWSGITTDPSGVIRACCWMTMDHTFNGKVSDYKNSKYLSEIKEDFINGRYPLGCKRCKWNDEKGFNSKRLRENKRWQDQGNDWELYNHTKLTMIDLRLSNTCNLGCIMCGPRCSSYLYQEIKNSNESLPDHWKNKISINLAKKLYPFSEDDIDEILSMMAENAMVYFTGGEPSLDKMVMKTMIKLIENGYNKTITLQFNSNFQSINKEWIDILKEFNGRMCPSIDGIGKIAEFIRYPCNWSQVNENINYFIKECGKTWEIVITPTISTLSIFSIYDIFSWANSVKTSHGSDLNISVSLLNRLDSPGYFDIRNLPLSAKNDAICKIRQIISDYPQLLTKVSTATDVIDHIKLEQNLEFKEAIMALDRIDEMRKTNWKLILSDLAKFVQ